MHQTDVIKYLINNDIPCTFSSSLMVKYTSADAQVQYLEAISHPVSNLTMSKHNKSTMFEFYYATDEEFRRKYTETMLPPGKRTVEEIVLNNLNTIGRTSLCKFQDELVVKDKKNTPQEKDLIEFELNQLPSIILRKLSPNIRNAVQSFIFE